MSVCEIVRERGNGERMDEWNEPNAVVNCPSGSFDSILLHVFLATSALAKMCILNIYFFTPAAFAGCDESSMQIFIFKHLAALYRVERVGARQGV